MAIAIRMAVMEGIHLVDQLMDSLSAVEQICLQLMQQEVRKQLEELVAAVIGTVMPVLLEPGAMDTLQSLEVVEGVIMEVVEAALDRLVVEDLLTVMGQRVHRLCIPLLVRMAMAVSLFHMLR